MYTYTNGSFTYTPKHGIELLKFDKCLFAFTNAKKSLQSTDYLITKRLRNEAA